MELDELKSILNEVGSPQKDAADLEKHLQAQSTSILASFQMNLRIELLFAAAFIVFGIIILFIFTQDYTRLFGLLLMGICAWFGVYVVWLSRKIDQYEKSALPLQQSLQEIILIIERFIKLYFQVTMLMIPGSFALAVMVAYFKAKRIYDPGPFFTQERIFYYAAFIVGFSLIMYFFTKWYLKRLYGNHLEKLRNQLKDLQNG